MQDPRYTYGRRNPAEFYPEALKQAEENPPVPMAPTQGPPRNHGAQPPAQPAPQQPQKTLAYRFLIPLTHAGLQMLSNAQSGRRQSLDGVGDAITRGINYEETKKRDAEVQERANRTAEAVAAKFGVSQEQAEAMVRLDPGGAVKALMTGQKPTSAFRPLTNDEKAQFGLDPAKNYQVDLSNNKISAIGGGGTSVNVNTNQMSKGMQKRIDRFYTAEEQALSTKAPMEALGALVETTATGPLTGALVQQFPVLKGFVNGATAFDGMVMQIVPQLRIPGSGAQSDKDMDILLNGAPSLKNNKAANRLIYAALQKKFEINTQLGQLAEAYEAGDIDRDEFRETMIALQNEPVISDQLQAFLDGAGGSSGLPAGSTATGGNFRVRSVRPAGQPGAAEAATPASGLTPLGNL